MEECIVGCTKCDQGNMEDCPAKEPVLTEGERMAIEWLSDTYAKGGFTENVIRQLMVDVSNLRRK